MINAADLLALRNQQMGQPQMQQQAPQQPMAPQTDSIWGSQSQRPRLRFGNRWIEPQDPMYDFIQKIMLQQMMPQGQPVQGAQG